MRTRSLRYYEVGPDPSFELIASNRNEMKCEKGSGPEEGESRSRGKKRRDGRR